MTTGQTVFITLGSVAVLAALAGGGYYLYRRGQQPVIAEGRPTPPNLTAPVQAVRPALPSPSDPTPPINPNATPADVLAEIQRQQALEAERQRQAEIRAFIDRIAAVENLQMLKLADIDAIERNPVPLETFEQEYFNNAYQSGRYQSLVNACRDAVWSNCGGRGFLGLGRCPDDNWPGCDQKASVLNGYFKGAWNNQTDRNPYRVLADEAGPYAQQRLAQWKADQKRPHEAKLVELEIQYRGMVRELKTRYGLDYTPQAANAYAGHERASQLLASGNYNAVQPYAVA